MLQDSELIKAIMSIRLRSEKNPDQDSLLQSFVDAGIKVLICNDNNQVVYGRRGTGKTHLFKILEPSVFGERVILIYIDARILGSSAQFSDPTVPMRQRCLSLFRDIFSEINETLLQHLVADGVSGDPEAALLRLDELMAIVIEPVERSVPVSVENTESQERGGSVKAELSAAFKGIGVSIGGDGSDKRTRLSKSVHSIIADEKVIFPDLQSALRKLLDALGARIVLLLDEWSSIPIDLQPFLAEFLKRSVLPNPRVTIKIASLEHRSQFSLRDERGNIVGLELGSDISANLDLDDFYVYDRDPERITDVYAEILFRHLELALGERLSAEYNITSAASLRYTLFVDDGAFHELVRAAEGVVRDLISIFTLAAINANRRKREKIDRGSIVSAAKQWYEQDKIKELSDDLREVLQRIVQEVIGNRRARAFLTSRGLERHPVIQRLFDARVLHVIQRGYADTDNPGIRHDIYSIDYATYLDLMNTTKAPQVDLGAAMGPDYVVPFNDRRSIRKVILDPEVLKIPSVVPSFSGAHDSTSRLPDQSERRRTKQAELFE
jgi:Cdc6-like AAA superfamily ATPase